MSLVIKEDNESVSASFVVPAPYLISDNFVCVNRARCVAILVVLVTSGK